MNKRLRLVRGNDSYLSVPVRNIVFVRDSEGRISKSELSVSLSDCSVLDVNVVCECGLSKSASFTVSGSSLMVKVAAEMDLPVGWYGLEVKYKLSGRHYRSFERDVFKVVESNGKGFVSGEQYAGEQSYQVDTMYTLMSVIEEEDLLAICERTRVYERGTGENSVQQKGTGAQAIGDNSHAEGYMTKASGKNCHAEGRQTEAGTVPMVEDGIVSGVGGENAHAEGYRTRATGKESHAEGDGSVASNTQSHAEGKDTTASGKESHAEGRNTEAAGQSSHAEGYSCRAYSTGSHSGGMSSTSKGAASVAQGYCVTTTNVGEAAFGRYNISNTGSSKSDSTIMSIGIGAKESERKNAIEVREDGSFFFWIDGKYVKLQDYLAAVVALVEATNGEIGISDTDAIPNTGEETPFTGDIALTPDEQGTYYGGSIGTWDDERSELRYVDLASQFHMTMPMENVAYYPIDDWNLGDDDLYDIVDAIWNSGRIPVVKAHLLFDGDISVPLSKGYDAFEGVIWQNGCKIEVSVTRVKTYRGIRVERNYVEAPQDFQYYYYNSIGSWSSD